MLIAQLEGSWAFIVAIWQRAVSHTWRPLAVFGGAGARLSGCLLLLTSDPENSFLSTKV